jgi:hypothetical protein
LRKDLQLNPDSHYYKMLHNITNPNAARNDPRKEIVAPVDFQMKV